MAATKAVKPRILVFKNTQGVYSAVCVDGVATGSGRTIEEAVTQAQEGFKFGVKSSKASGVPFERVHSVELEQLYNDKQHRSVVERVELAYI